MRKTNNNLRTADARAKRYAEVMMIVSGIDIYEKTRREPVPIVRAMVGCQLYEEGYSSTTAGAAVGLDHATILRHRGTLEFIKRHPHVFPRESAIWNGFQKMIAIPENNTPDDEDAFLKWWYIDECRDTCPTLADAIQWAKTTLTV